MLGTTTSVRALDGMPSEKSRRGSGCGATSTVAAQLTRAMPSSLKAITPSAASSSICHPCSCAAGSSSSSAAVKDAAMTRMGSRYAHSGIRRGHSRTGLRSLPEAATAALVRARPSSIR